MVNLNCSYVGDDGHTYSLSYEAGKDGFRPIGAHLPQEKMAPKALGIFPRLEQAWNDRNVVNFPINISDHVVEIYSFSIHMRYAFSSNSIT